MFKDNHFTPEWLSMIFFCLFFQSYLRSKSDNDDEHGSFITKHNYVENN